MKTILAITCMLLIASIAAGQSYTIGKPIEELRGDGIVSSIVVIPKKDFTDPTLMKYASAYLSRYRDFKLIQVGFYTDERTAWDFRGKSIDHFSYEFWKKEYEKQTSSGPIREAILLAYGNSGSLRIRDTDQDIREITIVGDNVFHPTLENLGLHILHIGFSEQGQPSKLTAHFYVTAPKSITLSEANKLAKSFFERVGIRNVTLNLREDEWFIFDAFYPWLNPFTRARSAPTPEKAARSVQFLCTPEQEDTCFQSALGTK